MANEYSYEIEKEDGKKCACARLESANASYKDLAEVCGSIRKKSVKIALQFLDKAAKGEIPVRYRSHNKKLGHRKELQGQKGRYPMKSAALVLGVLESALGNARAKGLLEDYLTIVHATANKKATYPRMAGKGRRARADYEMSRIEIILKEMEKTVEVKKVI